MPCTPCSTATTAVIDMYVCMHAFEYVHTPWPFSFFSLRIGGISFEEFSTGLRKLTHASDTSPIRVTPGDFDTLISISSEKGYPVPWLSALQIKKRFLCWVMERGSHEMLLAALFLHVFYSQSGIVSSLYILQLKFRGLEAKHTRCWRAPYAKRFRNHRATTSCLVHSGVSSSELISWVLGIWDVDANDFESIDILMQRLLLTAQTHTHTAATCIWWDVGGASRLLLHSGCEHANIWNDTCSTAENLTNVLKISLQIDLIISARLAMDELSRRCCMASNSCYSKSMTQPRETREPGTNVIFTLTTWWTDWFGLFCAFLWMCQW